MCLQCLLVAAYLDDWYRVSECFQLSPIASCTLRLRSCSAISTPILCTFLMLPLLLVELVPLDSRARSARVSQDSWWRTCVCTSASLSAWNHSILSSHLTSMVQIHLETSVRPCTMGKDNGNSEDGLQTKAVSRAAQVADHLGNKSPSDVTGSRRRRRTQQDELPADYSDILGQLKTLRRIAGTPTSTTGYVRQKQAGKYATNFAHYSLSTTFTERLYPTLLDCGFVRGSNNYWTKALSAKSAA